MVTQYEQVQSISNVPDFLRLDSHLMKQSNCIYSLCTGSGLT